MVGEHAAIITRKTEMLSSGISVLRIKESQALFSLNSSLTLMWLSAIYSSNEINHFNPLDKDKDNRV